MLIERHLTHFAKKFLQNHFDIKLSIPIIRNNRLRSTLGRYVMTSNGRPLRIELSGTVLTYGTDETIKGVLKHECIHYAFHILGKSMHDGDKEFEQALKRFNAPSTKTLKVGEYFVYQCSRCNEKMETRLKRLAKFPDDYRTGCCHGKINIIGKHIYRGLQ